MSRRLVRVVRAATAPPPATDAALLAAFVRSADPAAFAGLVRRHGPMVLGVCRRVVGHRHDAEDAFQAVFLVLARRAAAVRPPDAVGAWLHGVAVRVARKARSRRLARLGREGTLPDAVPSPEVPRPDPDVLGLVDAAVARLPPVYRAAVVACDLDGLSRAEAAARLGWKEGTLFGRLARGRQLLADRLRRQGVTAPAVALAGLTVSADLAAAACRMCDRSAGVPPAVAVLTHGVVQVMLATKLKFVAAAVVAAAGIGAWTAAGGDPPKTPDSAPPPTEPAAGAVADELKALAGDWMAVAANGKDTATARNLQYFRFDGDAVTSLEVPSRSPTTPPRGASGVPLRIQLDPSKRPKHMDIIGTKGPGKPITARCVYALSGDYLKLKIPYDDPDAQPEVRPATLDPEDKRIVIVWVRVGSADHFARLLAFRGGVWAFTRLAVGTDEVPAAYLAGRRLVVADDGTAWVVGDPKGQSGGPMSLRLTGGTAPRHIDLYDRTRPGDPMPGLCELNGDELTLCYRHAPTTGSGRPTDLTGGPGITRAVLKRVAFDGWRQSPAKPFFERPFDLPPANSTP